MKIKHAWLALTVALVGTVSAQVDPNRTIMIVNGEEIRGNEYYRRMEFLPGVGRTVNGKFVEAPPGILTMLRILDERLLLQLATQKGVGPTESEVQNEIKERMAGNPRLMEGLKALGLSDADLNYQVRVDLAEYKLRTQGITVTDQEVEKYFNDNPKLFSSAKSYKLRVIAIQDEAGRKAVDDALKAGQPFAEVAKKFSVEASKSIGGDIGTLPEDALSPAVRSAIEAVKIGQATTWIKGQSAEIRFLVENILPPSKRSLDPVLRREIRQKLMLDRGAVRNNLDTMMRDMRSKAVVESKQPQFSGQIKQYLDSAKTGG
ncbi:MAG TPA: peptidyl-prolyl cis-trans isomerase [Fimbriimonadaceae bacterium]|nr:peptidyl-prolyl cis-trans isomerase [Fimbriimonadaceae bacterium]